MPATAPSIPIVPGHKNVLYVDTGVVIATPVWVQVLLIDDVKIEESPEALKANSRFPDGIKRSIPGMREGGISFKMDVVNGDAVHTVLRNRQLTGRAVRVMISDQQATTPETVWDAAALRMIDWFMVELPRDEGSGNATSVDVKLTPTVVMDGSGVIQQRQYFPTPSAVL